MAMRSFTAAAASIESVYGDIDGNLAKIRRAARKAGRSGAALLLLPECSLTGGGWPTAAKQPAPESVALSLNSKPMDSLSAIAEEFGLIIAVGLLEKSDRGIYITQALVGEQGCIGCYRKVHEGKRSSHDEDLFPVFDLGFARVGISICRDNMLPECARILALNGAEVLLAPFMSLPLSRRMWRLMRLVALQARAQDNRLFVLSASHAQVLTGASQEEWGYSGICCAINPLGEVIELSHGKAGRPQCIAVELNEADRHRFLIGDIPAIRERRPGAYTALTDNALQETYRACGR